MTSYIMLWLSCTKPDVTIFRVSKATYEEATSMLYSESVFSYHIGAPSWISYTPSIPVWDRLTRIELDFDKHCWAMSRDSAFQHAMDTTLGMLTNPSNLRKSLLIKFSASKILETLSDHIFGRLKALVGFGTVNVAICASDLLSAKTSYMARTIEAEMLPTMGAATVSEIDSEIYFEFHPLEHAMKSRELGEEQGDRHGNNGKSV